MASIEARKNKAGEITSYRIVVSGGFDYTGKRIKHTKLWTPDKKMTARQLDKALSRAVADFEREIEQGFQTDNRQTFAQYAEYVIALKERSGIKPRTIDRYRELLPRINQAIGHLKLAEIRPQHLNSFYANLGEQGIRADGSKAVAKVDMAALLKKCRLSKAAVSRKAGISAATMTNATRGDQITQEKAEAIAAALEMKLADLFELRQDTRPLSDKTILEHHRLISTILNQAEREMLVQYNAAAKAMPPKTKKKNPTYYQPEEMDIILDALDTAPLKWKTLTYFLIDTGCRRGEAAGLKWESIDIDSGIVTIERALLYDAQRGIYEGTTKTGKNRTVHIAAETIALLKRLRVKQMSDRLASGDLWNDTGYVFTRDNGLPLNPDSITDWLNKFSRDKGLPHIHPHAFRHTAASMMISEGVDLVTAAHELGHANASTTATIYAHQIEEAQAKATEVRASVFARRKQA